MPLSPLPSISSVDYTLPALSIHDPWATSIVAGAKDVENRNWRDGHPGLRFRGRFLVHASKAMTDEDMESWRALVAGRKIRVGWAKAIKFSERRRGGIIGVAEIVDAVRTSRSKWFVGKWGLVIRNAQPVPFVPCLGKLDFFHLKLDPSGYPLAA